MPTITPTWVFDDTPIPDPAGRAARMLKFVDLLRHPASEGEDRRPVPHRWQRRIIERIYGPSDANGERQVRTVFAMLPRGARKTTLTAALALGHTIGPAQRPQGQAIVAASTREQAEKGFNEAWGFILADDRLEAATSVATRDHQIRHRKSRSTYTAIAADAKAQHGATPSFVHADELHVWRGFDLWSALRTGASKTAGSLVIVTTTAGQRSEGVCWDLYKYALRVLDDPARDPSFLPIIFQADDKADWLDEGLWHTVNPGLADGFPNLAGLRSEAVEAREIPAMGAGFRQTHLNIWSDGTAAGWIEASTFDEGAKPIDLDSLKDRPCAVGVDVSRSLDMTGIVAAFRDDDGGYTVLAHAILPEATFRKRMQASPEYDWLGWRESGALTVTPGEIISEDVIEACIRDLCGRFDVRRIGFDPKFALRIMGRLQEEGLPVEEIAQKPVLLAPFYMEMQRAMIARRFRHGGSPVLRHAVLNAVPTTFENGLFFLSKKKSGVAIDVAVACGMAVGLASEEAGEPSYFDAEDFDPQLLVLR